MFRLRLWIWEPRRGPALTPPSSRNCSQKVNNGPAESRGWRVAQPAALFREEVAARSRTGVTCGSHRGLARASPPLERRSASWFRRKRGDCRPICQRAASAKTTGNHAQALISGTRQNQNGEKPHSSGICEASATGYVTLFVLRRAERGQVMSPEDLRQPPRMRFGSREYRIRLRCAPIALLPCHNATSPSLLRVVPTSSWSCLAGRPESRHRNNMDLPWSRCLYKFRCSFRIVAG